MSHSVTLTSHYCDQGVTGASAPGHPGVCHYPGSWVMRAARMRLRPHIWAVIPMVQLPGYQVRWVTSRCLVSGPGLTLVSHSDTVHSTQYSPVQYTVHSTGILVSSEAAAQLMTQAWEISRVVLINRWKLSPSSSPNESKIKAHVKQFYYSPFRVCCFELSALDHFACLKRSLWHN